MLHALLGRVLLSTLGHDSLHDFNHDLMSAPWRDFVCTLGCLLLHAVERDFLHTFLCDLTMMSAFEPNCVHVLRRDLMYVLEHHTILMNGHAVMYSPFGKEPLIRFLVLDVHLWATETIDRPPPCAARGPTGPPTHIFLQQQGTFILSLAA